MGYRSKVIIGVKTGILSKKFDAILNKHEMMSSDCIKKGYIKIKIDPNDKTIYTFEYIKWYESHVWCKEIVDFLSKYDYHHFRMKDENVFCIGLGEDGQLHSVIGDPYEYVDTVSEINLID